jgi:hypothetical protein
MGNGGFRQAGAHQGQLISTGPGFIAFLLYFLRHIFYEQRIAPLLLPALPHALA